MIIPTIINFFKKYKTYILIGVIVLIIVLAFFPVKKKAGEFLTKRDKKLIEKHNKELLKERKKYMDSVEHYRNEFVKYREESEKSKTITVYIKEKTNEEVNLIPTLPLDSNVSLFARDLEEYIANR